MKTIKQIVSWMPGIVAMMLILCVVVSLGNYTAPTYAMQSPVEEVSEQETATDTQEETTELILGNIDLPDGIYIGDGEGYGGPIKVAVAVKDQAILMIDILSAEGEDEAFMKRATRVIETIMETQSTEVDTITGATYSSEGILAAVKDALQGNKSLNVTVTEQSVTLEIPEIAHEDETEYIYKDGTYEGVGRGFGGELKVQIRIKNGELTSIQILEHQEDSDYLNMAKGLLQGILKTQSTNVDVVSGATYSSVGLVEAVRNAMESAKTTDSDKQDEVTSQEASEEETQDNTGKFPYKDGIYYGVGLGFLGDIKTAVVLQNQTIKAILIVETIDDEDFMEKAETILDRVIEKQSVKVDTVSGATYSSEGILEAVKNALQEAKRNTNGTTAEDETQDSDSNQNESDSTMPDTDGSNEDTPNEDVPSEETIYQNGTYTAKVYCLPNKQNEFKPYVLTVKLTIESDKIVSITNVSGDGDAENKIYINLAANGTGREPGVITQILEKGMPEDIDVVSQATCTSLSIVEACLMALEEAKK